MDRVTKPQKKMLITLLRETKYMEGKKEKEWYWEKIQAALNTIGPKKTIIQWKKCWRDMRLTTRKKLAELKRCQVAGGSPPPGIELNQEDNDIIDIVGTEYFYEEMNGELKPENFMSNFDYVPEHFCDAILTAAGQAGSATTHMQVQHVKDQQQQQQQQQQHNVHQQPPPPEHHANEAESTDAAGPSAHNETHQAVFQNNVANLNAHNEHQATNLALSGNTHANMSQHTTATSLHGGLHPHLLRRQQQQQVAAAALQRENIFEEKLLQMMQDVLPKRNKRRRCRDPDKLFLLSLYDEIKRIPDELRLDVKAELIQVIKKYQKQPSALIKQEKGSAHAVHKQNLNAHNAHNMYQITSSSQSKYEKCEQEPLSPQPHTLDTNVSVAVHATQQLPHALFQLQKKYEDPTSVEKQQQNEQQRKQVEVAVGAVHHQQHAPPTPTSNDQQQQAHMHHTPLPHGLLYPLPPQQSNAQSQQQQPPPPPPTQQHAHNRHNSHQQQQQQQQQPQQPTHHAPPLFGSAATDRPSMAYENVG